MARRLHQLRVRLRECFAEEEPEPWDHFEALGVPELRDLVGWSLNYPPPRERRKKGPGTQRSAPK